MEKASIILKKVSYSFIIGIFLGSYIIPLSLYANTWFVDSKNGNDTFSGRSAETPRPGGVRRVLCLVCHLG